MYIGNIITSSKIEQENFKICKTFDEIDENLPTLIIGWNQTKELFGEGVSILHKKINDKLFWTFSGKERKSEYESDLDFFISYCYNYFGSNIPYVYLDLLYGKYKINYKIIKKILSLKNPITYISPNNMIYIYCDNIIFGVDLNILSLVEGKVEKVLKKVKNLENNILVESEIFNKCRDFIYKLKNKNRFIPYIYKYENG
jgi:hypothetical protein